MPDEVPVGLRCGFCECAPLTIAEGDPDDSLGCVEALDLNPVGISARLLSQHQAVSDQRRLRQPALCIGLE